LYEQYNPDGSKNPNYYQNPSLDSAGKGYISVGDMAARLTNGLPSGILAQINAAKARVGGSTTVIPSTNTSVSSDGSTTFQGDGSDNAKAAAQENSRTSGTDLNQSELGQRFLLAQAAEIQATAQAINAMKNTPPLRFLVNPSTFKVDSEKITNDGNWTRNGPIIEHWGDGQDKISLSGKIAAFFAIDATTISSGAPPQASSSMSQQQSQEFAGAVQGGGGPGLTRVARIYSKSYQNFLSLWLLYRNNAGIYLNGLDATYSSSKNAIRPSVSRLSMLHWVVRQLQCDRKRFSALHA